MCATQLKNKAIEHLPNIEEMLYHNSILRNTIYFNHDITMYFDYIMKSNQIRFYKDYFSQIGCI